MQTFDNLIFRFNMKSNLDANTCKSELFEDGTDRCSQ